MLFFGWLFFYLLIATLHFLHIVPSDMNKPGSRIAVISLISNFEAHRRHLGSPGPVSLQA